MFSLVIPDLLSSRYSPCDGWCLGQLAWFSTWFHHLRTISLTWEDFVSVKTSWFQAGKSSLTPPARPPPPQALVSCTVLGAAMRFQHFRLKLPSKEMCTLKFVDCIEGSKFWIYLALKTHFLPIGVEFRRFLQIKLSGFTMISDFRMRLVDVHPNF